MESQETAKRPIEEPNDAVAVQDAEPATKRVKLDDAPAPVPQPQEEQPQPQPQQTEEEKPKEQRQDDRDKRRGIAPIKAE